MNEDRGTFLTIKDILVEVFVCSWKKHRWEAYPPPPYEKQKGGREKFYFTHQLYECKRCHQLTEKKG